MPLFVKMVVMLTTRNPLWYSGAKLIKKQNTGKNISMADPLSARQQIVDKIKSSSNILVTVSRNPSVDELSAALGLTAMLNGLKKHATAIVSGDIPPAITFLDPDKTFENTVDSLRDFIIALDKEKADHLRYKVDGDVVKIFITPYRTTITQTDLEFTQGDYNVEFVIAIGVKDESHLDAALEAHGKILHDAAVATIDNEGESSKLGSIDWRDENASSISEMLVSLSEAIKGDKPVLDEQISTALLTGIVSATDRFSNNKTSSKVMTMAAQLMAAGANQQLIATKLQEAQAISTPEAAKTSSPDGTTSLSEGEQTKLESTPQKEEKEAGADGSLAISHEKEGSLEEVADQVAAEQTAEAVVEATDALDEAAQEKAQENSEDAARAAEQKLAEELQAAIPSSQTEPLLGSALNATSEQAADDKRREEDDDRNKTLLTHGETGHVGSDAAPLSAPPLNALMDEESAQEPPSVDPFAAPPISTLPPEEDQASDPVQDQVLPPAAQQGQTLADLDASVRSHEDPRAAIDAAFAAQPDPVGLPPMPDLSTLPPPPPPLPDLPPLQPSGPVASDQLGQIFGSPTPPPIETPTPESPSNDPNQFKIPGQ